MRHFHFLLRLRSIIGFALVISAVCLTLAVAFSRDNWIGLDAQEWNSWSLGQSETYVNARTDVHYRIDEQYLYGQRNGRVTLRTLYNTDMSTGGVGYAFENGWVSRTIFILKYGVFKVSNWKRGVSEWLSWYRWEERSYEFICPSQEIRLIKTRLEDQNGMFATVPSLHTSAAAGWSSWLDDWQRKVNRGDLVPLLNPLAPIWPRLCGEPHFSWEIYEQEQLSLEQEHHRIWIPFPNEIKDPTYTHASWDYAPMDICAERVPDGQTTCRLLKSGDSPARHALLLMPGRYRFFQRLHGEPQQQSCGNVLRGYGNTGPCNDGKLWYWRKASPPYAPVEVQLQDLGPGTSVGPQIRAFSTDF